MGVNMYDIVIAGYAGLSGSELIYERQELRERLLCIYPEAFFRRMEGFGRFDVKELMKKGGELSALYQRGLGEGLILEAGEGGIYAAIWRLLHEQHLGASFSQRAIPVAQQTVEICETFSLDPYRLSSEGTAVWLSKESGRLKELLEETFGRGSASVIGYTKKGPGIERSDAESIAYMRRTEGDELCRLEAFAAK